MNVTIFGAGLMARAVAFDFARQDDIQRIFVVDVDRRRLRALERWLKSPKIETVSAEATDSALQTLLRDCAVAISCVPYNYNLRLTRLCIAAGVNFCDLGGNNDVVRRQLALDASARRARVTVIPDCGLAPGMVNVLVADGVARLDKTDAVHIRVGGLPVAPEPPLFYKLVFSAQGLLNEYAEPCLVLRRGRVEKVKSLTGAETVVFPAPFGPLEAFHTSGGSSTLPETFRGKVQTLNYKTIRYPGHRILFQLLMQAAVGNWRRYPRQKLACALERVLSFEENDVVLLRVEVSGKKNRQNKTIRYQLIDYADQKTGLTAMMRTTGFSAAVVALLLARGLVKGKGVLPGEKAVPARRFIAELRQRGLNLKISSRSG